MTGVLLAGVARAEESPPSPFAESAVRDMLGGGAASGRWGVTAQGGWAWSAVRAQYGVARNVALIGQVETALGARWQPALGVSLRLVDRPHARVSAGVLLGWLVENTEVPKRGPTGEVHFRFAFPIGAGRWIPYLILGTRHALLPDRTTIEKASGTETRWAVRHEWTPWIGAGLGGAIKSWLGLDVGLDYGWIGAPDTIVLPGFHLGLHFGGGR